MADGLSKKQVREGLDNSIKDGVFTGAGLGIVNTYLTPFALALGASAAEIGFLSAVPQFTSTILSPFAGSAIEHGSSRKKLCGLLLFVSRLALVPIIWLAFARGFDTFSILLVFISISIALASFSRISWVSWMGDIVPEKIRGAYFGKRNMYIGISSLAVTLAGGWLLGIIKSLSGFAIVFSAAVLFYFIGFRYLMKVPDVSIGPKIPLAEVLSAPAAPVAAKAKAENITINAFEFLSSMEKPNFKRFIKYVTLFDFSVYLAAPFFTVYMLNELNIGYAWFAAVTAASAATAIVSQKYWGRLADRFGDRTVMVVCGMLGSMVPLLFVLSKSVPALFLANIFSGFAWAGLDLVIFNFILDVSPPEKRPLFVSNYQFFDGIAIAGGSIAGSFFISAFGGGFFGLSGIAALFVLATLLRVAFTLILLPKVEEERVKSAKKIRTKDVFLNATVIYPVRGISHQIEYIYRSARRFDRMAEKKIRGVFRKRPKE